LAERAVTLTLYVSLYDRRAAEAGGVMSGRDSRTYLAFSNALTRTMKALGIKAAAQPQRAPSLLEAAAAGRAERESGRFAA
jgi:hypothetical protein